jgi:hypothetical protein
MDCNVGPEGVETSFHAAPGDLAFLEYEIRLSGHGAFEGSGVLTFGEEGEHAIRFSSAQHGQLRPAGNPGAMAGGVSWRVDGGSGRFESATGVIATAFTLDESGQVSEYHSGLLFVPA